LPASAGWRVPSTGASSNRSPTDPAAAAIRAIPAGPTVLHCSQTASGPRPATTWSVTASTLSASYSIVTTTSLPEMASAISRWAVIPSPATASARSGVRFHTLAS
jgi:hypothetical protein